LARIFDNSLDPKRALPWNRASAIMTFSATIRKLLCCVVLGTCAWLGAADTSDGFTEHIGALTGGAHGVPVRLRGNEIAATAASFKPPFEVLIEAKTNSFNLTTAYGEVSATLNFDHGPKEGPIALIMHGKGLRGPRDKGAIPTNKYVTIHWIITPSQCTFSVNGEERYQAKYDFSKFEFPITVSTGGKAEVMVKSIKVKPLAGAAQ
jgi:hypothetical protein